MRHIGLFDRRVGSVERSHARLGRTDYLARPRKPATAAPALGSLLKGQSSLPSDYRHPVAHVDTRNDQHPDPPVRQSGYALVGDMAISCFAVLRPVIPQIMPELIEQIMPEPKMEFVSACNNAAWSVGEVALHYGNGIDDRSAGTDPEFAQWVTPLIQRLIPILLSPKSPKSLTENAAVTIGRLALVQPDMVSPHLEVFAQPWWVALSEIKDNDEKDSAFRGFCGLIERNPSGIAKVCCELRLVGVWILIFCAQAFVFFCNAVVRWTAPSQELNDLFSKILHGFKQMSGSQWEAQMAAFPEGIQERLRSRYQV
ncbi:transportin-PC [Rhizoctonia solani AG-1 IA]|uniref:Transportin-PC n=1 Tax=Thanatephorus cucumeris (strain AG1-IA) TaxID=983506 RepID=L8WQT1_THACA|nr:transportin-PC [Rhizoctonia solani AG-1 IA]